MENIKIVRFSALDPHQANRTVQLFVDSFYSMFKGISKDREILCKLFASCMRKELFSVLLLNDCVAGFVAVSDFEKRAIAITKDVCVAIFGKTKGRMLAWQLHKILGTPAVCSSESGYIDFLATALEYRRQGVAERLLSFVETDTDWTELYLDVLAANQPAVCLYKKLGYITETVKKDVWMRLAGIKAMYIMKKKINKESNNERITQQERALS